MAASTKNVRSSAKDDLKQQEITQAVVIADNFDKNFLPLTYSKPAVLLPVVNKTLLDYVLQSLEECGIQETFIFCCSHNQLIRSYISSSKWSEGDASMSVVVMSSSSFISVGDMIRELDSKALIRSDFILIKGDVITTYPLSSVLVEHKKRRQADKGCALTLLYRNASPDHKTRCKEDDFIVAVNSETKRIRFYQRINRTKTLNIPLEVFQENEEVTIHYDLLDSHICICSPCVPPLFSDNFDYQSIDDFVKGLIVNEELLGNSMYIHVVKSGYGASISNLCMYDAVSQDILNRWTYPIVPDLMELNGLRYSYSRHNIYKENDVEIQKNCVLKRNVAIGKGTKIGENSYISNSVIGRNCVIGKNARITGSYIWHGAVIGDDCKLDSCLLAYGVVLHNNVNVTPGCVIGNEVIIGENVSLPPITKLHSFAASHEDNFEEEDDFGYEKEEQKAQVRDTKLVGEDGHGFVYFSPNNSDDEGDGLMKDIWGKASLDNTIEDDESAETSSSAILSTGDIDSDMSEGVEDDYDDAVLFYNEVLESLQRGIEEKVKCENMILEINSSKHAYNVTMKEVNTLLIKAILRIPLESQNEEISAQQYLVSMKKVITFFLPLLSNYIRSVESQLECLSSIEEFMRCNDDLVPAVVKVLHFLYDKDILHEAVILKWFGNVPPENEKITKQVSTFIKWLQEADEESSGE